jgi:hypothetical protein
MSAKILTLKGFDEELKNDSKVDRHFLIPINDILLSVKTVERDKDRTVKTPYCKVELLIPHQVATTLPDLLKSDWKLGLIGIRFIEMIKEKGCQKCKLNGSKECWVYKTGEIAGDCPDYEFSTQ